MVYLSDELRFQINLPISGQVYHCVSSGVKAMTDLERLMRDNNPDIMTIVSKSQ